MRRLKIGVVQMAMTEDAEANRDTAEARVREAAGQGAGIVLIPELFEGHYFCKDQRAEYLARALPVEGHPGIARFSALARELGVVLPFSFYERAGTAAFNSAAMIDADGRVLGIYRKSHIPDGPGYQEKFYFSPGDTGFRVWETAVGGVGLGICWDQWFPETARVMALMGAEILLYPTAIGSEPATPGYSSAAHWQNAMKGHAAANIVPLAAANRVGREVSAGGVEVTFYGRSFIADHQGETLADAGGEPAVLVHEVDLDEVADLRRSWGVFRDRRPDLYGALLTLDGKA